MSLQITFLGHSSFHCSTENGSFFIDPFVTANPQAAHIDLERFPAQHIFVSHAHQDHTLDVSDIATRTGATIVTNYEISQKYAGEGLNAVGLNAGGRLQTPWGSVKSVPAIHSSSFPDGSYGGCPGGFVFMLSNLSFYFSGDTCLFSDMTLIPKLCGNIDFAILPIGGTFTMHADEALEAAKLVETGKVIGCHYDTFEPIEIDQEAAKNLFESGQVNLLLPSIGESLTF